jgi:hypothetical protein
MPVEPPAAAALVSDPMVRDARTDPFGVHLPADEVDIIAASGGSIPDWDGWETSFFERETQPLDPAFIPRPPQRPHSLAAALAVFACGLIAVVALSISAWIALSREGPPPATSSQAEFHLTPERPAVDGTTFAEESETRQDSAPSPEETPPP